MKKLSIAIMASLSILISCEQEEPIPMNEIALEQMVPAGHTKNFKITSSTGTMQNIMNSSYCNTYGGGSQFLITGTGKGSMIGRFNVTNRVCKDAAGNAISPFYGTLMTKNGSRIDTQLVFGPYEVEGSTEQYYDYVILGGAGKFAKVKGGRITMHGIVDYQNLTFDLKGEGVLEY